MTSATAALAGTTTAPAAATTTTAQTGAATTAAAAGATTPTAGNDEFAYAKDWEPEVREGIVKAGFKEPKAIAAAYLSAQKLLGVPADQIIRMPKADDLAARRDALSKFGIPATVEEYKIESPGADPEFLKTAASWMHEVGIPMREGQELAKRWAAFGDKTVKDDQAAWAAAVTKETGELNTEWGERGNANRAAVKEAQKLLGWDDATVDAMARAIGLKKTFSALAKVGQPMLPAEFKGGAGGGGGNNFNAMSPQDAAAKRNELMADGEWAKRWLAGDRAARAEALALDTIISDANTLAMSGTTYSQARK